MNFSFTVSGIQTLAMTHPLRGRKLLSHKVRQPVCWLCPPIVCIPLLNTGQPLASLPLEFLDFAGIQIKPAVQNAVTSLITINEGKRTAPTESNFTFCSLKEHLFSLLHEQHQMWAGVLHSKHAKMWNLISVWHTSTSGTERLEWNPVLQDSLPMRLQCSVVHVRTYTV